MGDEVDDGAPSGGGVASWGAVDDEGNFPDAGVCAGEEAFSFPVGGLYPDASANTWRMSADWAVRYST